MYLTKASIRNLGPIERLDITPSFDPAGSPKPIILVGANGGGKTVLLSTLAESLIEAAALKYRRVTPLEADGRNWYRISGGSSIRAGKLGALCYISFRTQNGEQVDYIEKAGEADVASIDEIIPSALKSSIPRDRTAHKKFHATEEQISDAFTKGIFNFISADRREKPSWLNPKFFIQTKTDDASVKQGDDIPNEVVIESALGKLIQWIPSLLIEARADVTITQDWTGKPAFHVHPHANTELLKKSIRAWEPVLKAFRLIVDDEKAMLGWMGRHAPLSVGYSTPSLGINGIPLDCLSKGQSSLLSIFLTLLKHADTIQKLDDLSNLTGICLIDEADAHLHTNLQAVTLPKLMAMFPKVQFIISTHSPLVVIGIEKQYGTGNCQIISMPPGQTVAVDDYNEHRHLFDVISATESFMRKAQEAKSDITIVLTEGKTDVKYLREAIEELGLKQEFDKIRIEEVGSSSPQPMNLGKAGLDNVHKALSGKAHWLGAKFILLYDADCNKTPINDLVSVACFPLRAEGIITNGIENFFPDYAFKDQGLLSLLPEAPNGPRSITLKKDSPKTLLCDYVCKHQRSALKELSPVLQEILKIAQRNMPKKS